MVSVGSGDEDGDGVTPGTGAWEVGVAKAALSNGMTQPTLVAADAPDTAAGEDGGMASPEGRNVSIGRVSAISKEDGTEMDHPIPALSPAIAVPTQEAMPQLSTLTQVLLYNEQLFISSAMDVMLLGCCCPRKLWRHR